jgi:KUP system potassium uptake protein
LLWRFGKEQQWSAEAEDRLQTSSFIKKRGDGQIQLAEKYGGGIMSPIRGFGIFFDKAGETTPIVFSQFAIKLVAAPEVMVFFHLRPLEKPFVAPEKRYAVSRLAVPNCYRLVCRYGFMDEVMTPDLAPLIYEQIRQFVIQRGEEEETRRQLARTLTPASPDYPHIQQRGRSVNAPNGNITEDSTTTSTENADIEVTAQAPRKLKEVSSSVEEKSATDIELNMLQQAYEHQSLYIIGKGQMRIKLKTNWFRAALLHIFLWVRDNTRTKIANVRVPMDRVIEVGFVKEV